MIWTTSSTTKRTMLGDNGATPSSDFDLPPPEDFSNMDISQIQAKIAKRQSGPAIGFLKLRLGVHRTTLKEFILNEPEAYELKIGDQVFRRPGDPPLDEVIERLRSEKNKADDAGPQETDAQMKEELLLSGVSIILLRR